jgi:hypothetical protein
MFTSPNQHFFLKKKYEPVGSSLSFFPSMTEWMKGWQTGNSFRGPPFKY